MGMDVNITRPTLRVQGRQQTNQAEAMVSMKVGDEYMVQSGDTDTKTAHLMLRSLTAINHEHLLP